MDEQQVMGLLTSHSTWEDVIYKIIGFEGLDPWNLDLLKLSSAFLGYLKAREAVDFSVPAKFIIIAAVLLRMKSEQLEEPEPAPAAAGDPGMRLVVSPLELPAARLPARGVMVTELVSALRRVLATDERRRERHAHVPTHVVLEEEDIGARIARLASRIELLLAQLKHEEIPFSKLVPHWDRSSIVETFLPLIYLDNEQKVRCRQDESFAEIYIRKPETIERPAAPPTVPGAPSEIKPAAEPADADEAGS